MSKSRVRNFLAFTLPIAAGYGVMKTFVIDEKEIREVEENVDRYAPPRKHTQAELVGLMLKQNMESNRPAWDVRPVVLPERGSK